MNEAYDSIKNEQIVNVINDYIHSERDRIILKANLVDGWSYQQISDYLYYLDNKNKSEGLFSNYYLSDRQVGRVILKQEKVVFKHLQNLLS